MTTVAPTPVPEHYVKYQNFYKYQDSLHAHTFAAPGMLRTDDGSNPAQQTPKQDVNAAFNLGQQIYATPYAQTTYQETDPAMMGKVYAGIYTDPQTGQQYHTFEEAMPDREHEETINPSRETMDRLMEQYTGGATPEKMGLPDYKPEKNFTQNPLTHYDAYAKYFGDFREQRAYEEQKVNEQLALTRENNFAGLRQDMGNMHNHIGFQPIEHGDVRSLRLVHRPEDIDHRYRHQNPTSETGRPAPRTVSNLGDRDAATSQWFPRATHDVGRFQAKDIQNYNQHSGGQAEAFDAASFQFVLV